MSEQTPKGPPPPVRPPRRRASAFKQSDIARALKAAVAAGLEVTGFTIDPTSGSLSVSTGDKLPDADDELARFRGEHGYA